MTTQNSTTTDTPVSTRSLTAVDTPPSPKASTFGSMLIGVLMLIAIVLFALAIAYYALSVFLGLNPNVAAAIVAAFATVVVSVLSVIVGKHLEAMALVKKEHREKKVPVYEDLIKFWFKHLFASKAGGKPLEEAEFIAFLTDFTQRMMVWGSDEVIAAWVEFRYASMEAATAEQTTSVLDKYELLILAIRRDLGHKNKGLKHGDILRLFVNDMESNSKRRA